MNPKLTVCLCCNRKRPCRPFADRSGMCWLCEDCVHEQHVSNQLSGPQNRHADDKSNPVGKQLDWRLYDEGGCRLAHVPEDER